MRGLLLQLSLLGVLCGCSEQDRQEKASALHELRGPTMGSGYQLKWHGKADPAQVKAAVEALLAAADKAFSNWRPDSEIAAFNAHRSTAPFPATAMLQDGVRLGLQLAAATSGAFDPTVKPLSQLYRQSKKDQATIDESQLQAALAQVGHGRLSVQDGALHKQEPWLQIDLDGVVAGLCADQLAPQLADLGVDGFMLDITGEVLCRGRRPDGQPWRIGIVDPEQPEVGREGAVTVVPLLDRALCTSGSYRNFTVVDGKAVTHVFDPRTGRNPGHGVVSVSVLARSCALADGLATALMVLGPTGAPAALQAIGETDAAAWFVVASADGSLESLRVGWPEAFSAGGEPRFARVAAQERAALESDLRAAEAAMAAAPDSVEAHVWVGRRLGYLGRFRDAIAAYTDGLARFPDEPHLLRHRGHRHLSVRDFAAARADLELAEARSADLPDEIEPDGRPVPGRPPHSTLKFNIRYHLGLACFCAGDFAAAESAWRACLQVANNDESQVAVLHWLCCALLQQGREAEMAALLAALPAQPDVVENRAYLELCRLYAGQAAPSDLGESTAGQSAALSFGLAHLRHVRCRRDPSCPEAERQAAHAALEAVAQRPDWASFGTIAAEALLELERSAGG